MARTVRRKRATKRKEEEKKEKVFYVTNPSKQGKGRRKLLNFKILGVRRSRADDFIPVLGVGGESQDSKGFKIVGSGVSRKILL